MMLEIDYLKQALVLASNRRGFCAPNPAVGAVVVKNNQVISSGEHWAAGYPHAEVMALKNLPPEVAKDAVLYVTLEPCCHMGRTPPCTDLIIQSGVKKVIYAFSDPNPKVNKQGEKILKQSGIDCHQINVEEINQFYESYAWWQAKKIPWVTAKLAVSFDGKIAGKNSQRLNLTGKAAQQFTHQCRKRADAILTTANTILADDPELNIRIVDQEVISKPVYIIDRQSRVLPESRVFKKNHHIKVYDNNHKDKDLLDILKDIGKDGIQDLWVEAGGQLFSALIQEKLIQRAFIYIAPMTIGQSGLEGFITQSNLFENIKEINWQMLDKDVIGEVRWE